MQAYVRVTMKSKKTIRLFYAWMLATTFMTALLVKDMHLHDVAPQFKQEAHGAQQTSVSANCYICNFVMCKANAPKLMVYVPTISVSRLARVIFTSQIVYRQVDSINSHSPPTILS